jgi:translation initiation factor IF-2
VLDEAVGDVTDADVKRAIAGGALIVGFKNRAAKSALALAEIHRISIITSPIIYELVKAIEEQLVGKKAADVLGELEILAVFNQEKSHKQVVGGKVVGGSFRNKTAFEIRRGGETMGMGRVTNLQSQKKDVNHVAEGNEAGLMMQSDVLVQVGDRLVMKK